MALLLPFEGASPRIHETAWIAPNATIIGDVTIEAHASVWYGAVIRGDMAPVVLGEGSNLQDGSVVHVDTGVPATIGRGVGIGHAAIIHGATVHDAALIGMGARLLNGSVVGSGSLVAAGAVLLEGHEVPPNSIAAGVPAKVRGEIEDAALRERVRSNAEQYVQLAARHRGLEPLA
ncbi:MAG: gamma carbonic anhydrase family protein [Actinomycetales bacterium]|nr:gamma carbonic anhydrase family protein [Actinomycetales bacterium]